MKKYKLLTTLAILLVVLFAGCRNDDYVAIDGGPCPEVKSTTPVSGATLVGRSAVISETASEQAARTTHVTATFNKKIDSKTITGSSFIVKVVGGSTVDGNVTYSASDSTAVFIASNKFPDNTQYEARVTTAVKDLIGNALQQDYVWTFSTGTTILPIVIATSPINLATNVAFNKVITATFSVPMDQSTITLSTFTLTKAGVTVLGDVSTTGAVASFTPKLPLSSFTVYTAKISAGVMNLDASAMANDVTWTFTTADIVPRVITTDPLKAATNVPLDKTVSAIFSVAMNSTTITTSTFTLMNGAVNVIGVVGYSGTTATFNPNNDLLSNTLYIATIKARVKNTNGTSLAKDTVWSFTTETVSAPYVTSTDPSDQDASVTLNQDVTATFSEAMNNSTITTSTFTIMEGLNQVFGVISYSGNSAIFNPDNDFAEGKTYTATITNGVKNAGGTNMVNNYVWKFTIPVAGTAGPLPINLGCAEPFAVLAGSTITSTGPSIINGDVGLSPGSALIGFPPGIINGTQEITTPTAADAKGCLTSAYIDGQGRSLNAISLPGQLGGLTLAPGLYSNSSSSGISGTGANGILTLDAQGNANAVWIFQIGSTLTTDSGTSIVLAGGAQAKNIFWIVGTSATLGTTSIFYGNILADQAITLKTGAVLNGRALTRIAAVTLDDSNITIP